MSRKVRALAVDIDGTLTIDRGVFTLDLEAARMLRELALNGIYVILVTGNSIPVVAGLARYLGFEKSPHVAENGCLVFYRGKRIRVCPQDAAEAAKTIEEVFRNVLEPSWQNVYRHCDYAFTIKQGDPHRIKDEVKRLLEERGFNDLRVGFSGYAIHVQPRCVSKAAGLHTALKLIGVNPSEAIAVGDSGMDAELKAAAELLFAVGNADEELKKTADYTLPGKSGASVRFLVGKLIEADFDLDTLKTLLGMER